MDSKAAADGRASPRFSHSGAWTNQLLAHLPPDERQKIRASAERVKFVAGATLFEANAALHTAYFPETGVIALVAGLADGETLEVGIVGRDGMAGLALIPGVNMMPFTGVVQIGGAGLRISSQRLRELIHQNETAYQLFGAYAYSMFTQGVQRATCNTFHSLKQRCARWLLMLHDLADDDAFPLTQNLLALMLGVRRPTVTIVARQLHEAEIVQYHHGRMRICDRSRLEAIACDCYWLIRDEQKRLLGY